MADVDLLIKLFDTLKDSSKDTQQMCQIMLTNQTNISNYIKNLPLTDLKDLLKDHAKTSGDDIETCTETVETKSDDILKEVTVIKGKVKTMITVVIVAFTLFTIASFIGVITYHTRKAVDVNSTFGLYDVYDPEKAEQQHEDLKNEIMELLKEELKRHNKETEKIMESK